MGWRDWSVPTHIHDQPIATTSPPRPAEVVYPIAIYESYSDYDSAELSIGTASVKTNVPKPMIHYVALTVFNSHATQTMYVDIDRPATVATGMPVYALQSVTIPCRVREYISCIADGAATTGTAVFWSVY